MGVWPPHAMSSATAGSAAGAALLLLSLPPLRLAPGGAPLPRAPSTAALPPPAPEGAPAPPSAGARPVLAANARVRCPSCAILLAIAAAMPPPDGTAAGAGGGAPAAVTGAAPADGAPPLACCCCGGGGGGRDAGWGVLVAAPSPNKPATSSRKPSSTPAYSSSSSESTYLRTDAVGTGAVGRVTHMHMSFTDALSLYRCLVGSLMPCWGYIICTLPAPSGQVALARRQYTTRACTRAHAQAHAQPHTALTPSGSVKASVHNTHAPRSCGPGC